MSDRFAYLDQPELAKAPGVHDGRRTEPCSCIEYGADDGWEAGYVEDQNWSPEDLRSWARGIGERTPGAGLIQCGRCGGDGWVYSDCTRCGGSGAEPVEPEGPAIPDALVPDGGQP